MDILIEVDGPVEERVIQGDRGPMRFREQRAYLFRPGERYPLPFKVSLGDRGAYAAGRYRLGPASVVVGKWGRIELARDLELIPAPAVAAAATAVK